MSAFTKYESQVIDRLTAEVLSSGQVSSLNREGSVVSYKYTGHGYFLTVEHPALPVPRIVCSQPIVTGSIDDYMAGFVIFLGDHQLTFECYTLGENQIPSNFRDLEVQISAA